MDPDPVATEQAGVITSNKNSESPGLDTSNFNKQGNLKTKKTKGKHVKSISGTKHGPISVPKGKHKKSISGKKRGPVSGPEDEPEDKPVETISGAKPGREPVPREKLLVYSRGEGMVTHNIKNEVLKKKLFRQEKRIQWAEEQAARAEILLTEDSGFLVADKGESTSWVTQQSIKKEVDITSAAKCFELDLSFGPYRLDYSRNGRFLLLGGRQGHVAAFDWVTKRLKCEINVMEELFDVQWLHIETMFAVAQKEWVYIYEENGVEIHCLKALHKVLRMAFLPYHFLLATSSETGWLRWLDISIGKIVKETNTRIGRLSVMEQNPYNAVLCVGSAKGVVSMWSPNSQKPLVQMMCHPTGVEAIAIDKQGKYMATSSANNQLKIWDLRQLSGPLQYYRLKGSPRDLSFSQRGLLAASINNTIQVYKSCHLSSVEDAYMWHRCRRTVYNIEFCPYEDFLGIGTGCGFTSMIVPGAGEPNFDGYEANPYWNKSQRREAEVKALLEKIQPEMITLDPTIIGEVDVPTFRDRLEAKTKIMFMKPQDVDFTPRKKKRHGSSVKASKAKKIMKETHKKEFLKNFKEVKDKLMNEENLTTDVTNQTSSKKSVLDRFRSKTK